jgi:membrane associated rhomboid family serine protease
MFPLKDDNPTSSFPYITIAFIIINVVIFVLQVVYESNGTHFTAQFAVIPLRFTSDIPLGLDRITTFKLNPYLTLISYAFMHGGVLHLAFNMLFLWIFGNNIEDALGRIKFIFFYIACGVVAATLHIVMNLDSPAQMVGASGSIAGILGAYLILYPHANIHSLFVFFFIVRIIKVPAVFFIGFWFFIQIMSVTQGTEGSVAWYAHIGGFISGVTLIMVFKSKIWKKKKRPHIVYH